MTDLDALLAAVLAAPDDDLPRLIYADAVEEAGDAARAEFIRVQIELARTPGRVDLKAREAALLAVHGKKWLAPLRKKGEGLEGTVVHGQFRRGFVEVVWMPAGMFLVRAERLMERAPVRELRVTRMSLPELTQLLDCRFLTRLRALDLSDRKFGDRGIRRIIQVRGVSSVRVLRLRACNLSGVGAAMLVFSEFNWPLGELDVSLNNLSEGSVETLRNRFGHEVVKFEPPPPTDSIPAPPGR